jgi:peptide/nickel transport system substrate-binding protein
VYASGADLQSINPLVAVHPLARQVQRHVLFTTLVRLDSALSVEPYLARSWSWSAGGRELIFRLHPSLRWHDGTPVSAADAAFTLEAARDPATAYPRGAELSCLLEAAARDSLTLVLRFCRPVTAVPDVLADLAILPAHRFGGVERRAIAAAPFNSEPVGNGPFRFVSWEPGRRWVFEANPGFPAELGGPPLLRRLVVAVVDEATTKLAGLVAGELDFAGIAPPHAAVVERVDGLAVRDYPLLLSYGLVWNTARPPFDDVRMRRALTLAINRPRIVAAALYGFAEVAHGPVPPAHPRAVTVESLPFDAARAGRELEELGWVPDGSGRRARAGRTLAFTITTTGTSDNVLEQLIQADLGAIGVTVRIRQLELGAFLAAARSRDRDYDALVTGIPGDLALGWLGAMFDSRRRDGPLQYSRFASNAMDAALDAEDWAAVQHIAARDLPVTWLYHARGVQGVNTRVHGVRFDLRGELASLHRWRVAPPAARAPRRAGAR